MMGDLYRDAHRPTQGRNKSKQKMPHTLVKADKKTHALTSLLNNQLWNLQDKSQLFPEPGVRGAIIFQSA